MTLQFFDNFAVISWRGSGRCAMRQGCARRGLAWLSSLLLLAGVLKRVKLLNCRKRSKQTLLNRFEKIKKKINSTKKGKNKTKDYTGLFGHKKLKNLLKMQNNFFYHSCTVNCKKHSLTLTLGKKYSSHSRKKKTLTIDVSLGIWQQNVSFTPAADFWTIFVIVFQGFFVNKIKTGSKVSLDQIKLDWTGSGSCEPDQTGSRA